MILLDFNRILSHLILWFPSFLFAHLFFQQFWSWCIFYKQSQMIGIKTFSIFMKEQASQKKLKRRVSKLSIWLPDFIFIDDIKSKTVCNEIHLDSTQNLQYLNECSDFFMPDKQMKDIIVSLCIHVTNPIYVQSQKAISQDLLFYFMNHAENYRSYLFKKINRFHCIIEISF